MAPHEFVARYGYPKVTMFPSVAVGTVIAPRDPYRYLLYVTVTGAAIVLTPGEQDSFAAAGAGIAADSPLDLSFCRHGSLVCERFVVSAVGGVAHVVVSEGRADSSASLREGLLDGNQAIPIEASQSLIRRNFRPGARSEFEEKSDLLQPVLGSDLRRRLRRRGRI